MDLQVIDPFHFSVRPHALFDRQAMLLTSGDFAKGNGLKLGLYPQPRIVSPPDQARLPKPEITGVELALIWG